MLLNRIYDPVNATLRSLPSRQASGEDAVVSNKSSSSSSSSFYLFKIKSILSDV